MVSKKGLLSVFSNRRGVESGVTTVEYAAMLVLVAISVAAFGLGLGGSVTSVYSRMIVALADGEDGEADPIPDPIPTCCDD